MATTQPSPPVGQVPPPRSGHGLAADANGNIVLFGGNVAHPDSYLNDTWTWNGSTWTRQQPDAAPLPRCCFQMAYDAARRETVLYGGWGPLGDGWYFNDTWTWDGSTWEEQVPATEPPFATNYGMAYDATRRLVIAFMGGGGIGREMWGWDGGDWTELHPSTLPAWRELEGLAYDGARRQLVMFGGWDCGDFCIAYDETWSWDGVDWTLRDPRRAPGLRFAMGMAYDVARRDVVLFAGTAERGFTNETWIWNGRTWTRVDPTTTPAPRERVGMAWDPVRRQVVMFGGRDQDGGFYREFNDTWVWDGVIWRCVSVCS